MRKTPLAVSDTGEARPRLARRGTPIGKRLLLVATIVFAVAAVSAVRVGLASDPSNQVAVVHLSATDLTWIDTGVDVQPDYAYR